LSIGNIFFSLRFKEVFGFFLLYLAVEKYFMGKIKKRKNGPQTFSSSAG
jgi:hypothetical protein